MAKESMKARERKRKAMYDKFEPKRAKLKAEGDYVGLQKLPKNSSKTRLHNRCSLTGRPKGYRISESAALSVKWLQWFNSWCKKS
jgi:small subunit ribosomal protein S14